MPEKSSARILVIEDERNVASTLVERLEKEGFSVTWAQTAEEARQEISRTRFDLALVDVGLPDGSGFDVAAALRKKYPTTALIFLTAFANPEDRVHGLELGAEDYVVKPFNLKELLLRIHNGLKRARYLAAEAEGVNDEINVGRAVIRFSKFEAEAEGQIHSLTHKETALLKLLIERKGKVVSRDEILDRVWSENEFPTSRTVDNFIMRLRRLIEKNPEDPMIIKSIRGVGYQLVDGENT